MHLLHYFPQACWEVFLFSANRIEDVLRGRVKFPIGGDEVIQSP
ncbi:hypothetical protein SAMN02787079_01962 [Lysinibacillus sp. TC-37]|jgi:hypothetical protein|nr:hypothetical protein SAMN02787078_01921 [Lysinibacillus sp. SG9]SDB26426.1 hypothetical protein SAMN02787079_01962 [Lysinibacillus sp. TC-37]SFS84900.1 hypothetical protein SAMN02787087_02244 [Lysinibacillus sp. SG55]